MSEDAGARLGWMKAGAEAPGSGAVSKAGARALGRAGAALGADAEVSQGCQPWQVPRGLWGCAPYAHSAHQPSPCCL